MKMWKACSYLVVLLFMVSFLSACGPAKTDVFVEVKSNETAFVVPLEGDTAAQKRELCLLNI